MEIIKTAKLVDSQGNTHQFNLVREVGGYTLTWDNLDWSFPSVCFGLALTHCEIICSSETEVDYIINWVNG